MVRVLIFISLLAGSAAMRQITIGAHLNQDEDMDSRSVVYDGRNPYPLMSLYREENCKCQDCARCAANHCHIEPIFSPGRFFYVQLTEQKPVVVGEPNITVTPFCLDQSQMTLKVTSMVRQPVLERTEAYSTIEMDFECTTRGAHTTPTGMFEVEVALPVREMSSHTEETIKFYFRKYCVPQWEYATGMSMLYVGKKRQQSVVSSGKAVGIWHPQSRSDSYDLGYDPNDRDFKFEITYRSDSSVGPLTFQMMEPQFDQTIFKRVWFKGPQIGKTTSVASGDSTLLKVHVTCQSHPRREDNPGDIRIGLNVLQAGSVTNVRDVEFKFQVECPYHGNRITPMGVLAIVVGAYLLLGCVGGYAYNVHYTPRRGVDAVPLLPALLELVTRKRRGKYYPIVEDADADMMAEEIMSSKYAKRHDEYGAI